MLTAGIAAAGTGLSAAAFGQTRIHIPGSATSGTGPVGGGNQIRTPGDIPVGARGNAIDAIGNQMAQCWGCVSTAHGFGRDVLATRSAAEPWDGHTVAKSTGPTTSGLGSRSQRGTDAVTSLPPFIRDSRPGMPNRFGADDSPAVGRSEGSLGPARRTGRDERRGGRLGRAVQPWRARQPWRASQVTEPEHASWVTGPRLVNQSGWVNQIGPGTESGRFIQTGQESQTGHSSTSDATGVETQLATLPLAARPPLAASTSLAASTPLAVSTPSLSELAGLGGAIGLARLVTAHGAGVLPLAALILLAGASVVKLAGRRRRGVRGVQRGAITS